MITIFQQEILFFPLFPRYTPNNGTCYNTNNLNNFTTIQKKKHDRN